ncbi:sensor histidine kinase [Nonomuraea indica]|uniref:sensor histidine kinase n=1 Tax=Nonomuraea indica TaxID=1581193 RepID=UPI0015DF7F62|nr:histidine kinase [Nonomuraea indica]
MREIGWRTLLTDALPALGVAAVGSWTTAGDMGGFGLVPHAAVEVACGAALLLRRYRPAPVTLGVAAASLAGGVPLALPFAVYALASRVRDPRLLWGVAALTVLATGWVAARSAPSWVTPPEPAAGWTVAGSGPDGSVLQHLAAAVSMVAAPLLLGLYVRARRDLAMRESDTRVERARTEERARLAREMHDVVTHRVSLMVLQAGTLRLRAQAARIPPEEVESIAEQIRQTGSQALDELRAVVGVLRSGDVLERVPLAPPPALPDLRTLVEENRSAGVEVDLVETGEPVETPPPVSRTAYRIVQEALTNARKHAPGAPVAVEVESGPERIRLRVTNGPAADRHDPLPGGGAGLLGLRERVALVGGTLRALPTLPGGYEVTAELPVHGGAS